ncbi:SurA N-terminal domain-containing protein [Lentibacillus sp. CBA3610]|uniref:SurA N-terminal domain-containing protein n=1 Tax=Lentibacillus sp. CBA3610 TaxID=2518176 RepID=UPI0015950D14|nr:SurA N-terminal domain-containing protein [Lentibacillus sp. CBA3610]QKY71143.1 peptidylprolyl isomerase [Lentibacillus sp. CBA3610]
MKKFIMLMMALSLAVVLAACNGDSENNDDSGNEGNEDEQASQQQEMPEPDLEGVPDVVAEVNGEEITKEEFESTYQGQFQQMAMQAQMTGQEIDQNQMKQQTAEGMVGTELIIQEANNRDYSASDEEVDETLNELAQQNQIESTDEFISALEEQGMAEDEIMSQVETQVKIDKLIAEESGDLEPTEEELQSAYDQFKSQQEQMSGDGEEADIPSFDEMKSDLETQVRNQKQGQATQSIIDQLREDADVTINI